VAIFMVPYKEDFYKLGHHSSWFWEDHGLVTNVQKRVNRLPLDAPNWTLIISCKCFRVNATASP
jgi:hypothetical protein